jgi:indolepyruvate ferredoxin oxidoreductase alpha subunit
MVPGNAFARHVELEKKLVELKKYSERTPLNRVEMRDTDIGFITDSVSYLYVREAFPNASVLKLGFTYPFPDDKIADFAKQVKRVVIVEELEPFIEDHVRSTGIKVSAKDPSWKIGEFRPEDIPSIVEGKQKTIKPNTSRKPVLCPGCMHRPVFVALKKNKVIATGDIGCYTLGALKPLSTLDTCLCMGSAITLFEGFYRSLGKGVCAVIGDSTFIHSGIPGLINAVYNKAKGFIVILDNGTTAMTGSQPHPAAGMNAKGEKTKQLSIEGICEATGADKVVVVDPFDPVMLDKTIKEAAALDGLSVIIARYPCRILHRKKETPPVVNNDKCKKCGQCLVIDCPALYKKDDGFISIDPNLCTGCGCCVTVCKFGALEFKK